MMRTYYSYKNYRYLYFHNLIFGNLRYIKLQRKSIFLHHTLSYSVYNFFFKFIQRFFFLKKMECSSEKFCILQKKSSTFI